MVENIRQSANFVIMLQIIYSEENSNLKIIIFLRSIKEIISAISYLKRLD